MPKTFATICDGVMPTTGTLALGYVIELARPGMYVCMGRKAGWTGWEPNIPTGAGVVSKAKGKGCMEPGSPERDGWSMEAPDILGPDMVGMDMEGRDIGGPDTGGPGIRGTDDIDMGGRGIGA